MPPSGPSAGATRRPFQGGSMASPSPQERPTTPPPSNAAFNLAPPTFGPGGAAGPFSRGKMPNAPGPIASFGGDGTFVPTPAAGFKGGGIFTTSGNPDTSRTGGGGGRGTGSAANRGAQMYGGYTREQLMANPELVKKLGQHALSQWLLDNQKPTTALPPPTPAPAATTAPTPSPFVQAPGAAPGGAPRGSSPAPPPGGGDWVKEFQDPFGGGWGTGQAGEVPQPYAFNDPFNALLSAFPLMDLNAKKQISGAMADAGFTGNRYGSAAMRKAGEIGSENALAENQLANSVLSDFANKSEDRALQATGMGTSLGALLDAIQQNKINVPLGAGQLEQGRQDQFANTRFQDWSQNRLGWFPYLLQAAMSRNAGSPGSTFAVPQPGKPSTLDQWGPLIGAFLGGLG